MRIIFSRKGFDSGSGGGPSPIVAGRPVTLPIPNGGYSRTRWSDLGLGDHVATASRGKMGGADFCHHDPMFLHGGTALLGQCHAAQSHLVNQGVAPGDVFLFFGLFAGEGEARHHRIFGWLEIAAIEPFAGMQPARLAELQAIDFPHAIGMHSSNDAVYSGTGGMAVSAHRELRLTHPDGPLTRWLVPAFLRECGLSYHGNPARWRDDGTLTAASRGQEFVCDIGAKRHPREWLARVLRIMREG